ncbi:MAG: AAA family ATPase [Candidatus Kapabacteria bacterium]|jgi:AAA15 family ATPase/GTPase|nr:AAA family ATPase [Candidatus Kapabacteria bacterium]
MRIQSLQLKNFKRFTDLTITNIPETAKLVLLIGGNGSGKSCVFDAFDWAKKLHTVFMKDFAESRLYYRKQSDKLIQGRIHLHGGYSIPLEDDFASLGGGPENSVEHRFFGRSSNRIIPEITNTANPSLIATDGDAPLSYIHNDTRFINDAFLYIDTIDKALRAPVFRGEQVDVVKIFHEQIKPLNDSLNAIFGDNPKTTIQVVEIQGATPTTPAKPVFRKGDALINYDLLSHGEKQVVILLLNFIVRKKYYEDSIIFIDEMDCHLNTALQFNLLKEIVTRWIPDTAQLWTASHALGFIDYARSSDEAATIDFDLLDFDVPQTLVPVSKEKVEVYDIAIPKQMLSIVLGDRRLVFCENKNDVLLNLVGIEKTIFVGVRDSAAVFLHIKRDTQYHSLRDRDFLTDTEIERLAKAYPQHHILRYYCFENYLYHPDNIAGLAPEGFDKEVYIQNLMRQKKERENSILMKINDVRNRYEEFKTDAKLKDDEATSIAEDVRSDDFERWYKFFSMKEAVKTYLAPFQLKQQDLVQTAWFKQHLSQIIQKT